MVNPADAGERIWVTGVGLVTALGNDVARTWPRLVAGERGLAALSLFDTTGQRAAVTASIDASPELLPPGGATAQWSRTSRFAWKAATEAVQAAGLGGAADWASARRRVGLILPATQLCEGLGTRTVC